MKKLLLVLGAVALISLPFSLKAQDDDTAKKGSGKIEKNKTNEKIVKKETQEIVIRNKRGKDLNLKVEINGDKITVNGKPLEEFKDDQVSINNRKIIIRDGNGSMNFNFTPFAGYTGQWNNGKEEIKPFLGVTTEKVTEGAKITEVIKESAAEKAGLQKDDIIVKVGDDVITDGDNLSEVVTAKKPKEVVNITYLRNGKESSVKATLGQRKSKSLAYAYSFPRGKLKSFSIPKISGVPNVDIYDGEGLNNLDPLAPAYDINSYLQLDNTFARQKRLGLKIQDTEEGGNVKVIDVEEGSAAEKAGLKKDDIITEIGGEKIENTDDAREQLMPSETKSAYTIKAKRNGTEMTFEVKFPKKLKTANL
ncbi:MAG: PDZ domain-containing protein [Ferruginibacter sp.]